MRVSSRTTIGMPSATRARERREKKVVRRDGATQEPREIVPRHLRPSRSAKRRVAALTRGCNCASAERHSDTNRRR